MHKEIQAYSAIEDIRQDLWARRDFSLLDSFDSIDRYRDGYVTEYSLRSFLSRNGHFVTDDDILAIMRRLDHDEDGRLNSFEFNEALMKAETGIRSRDHGSFTPSASMRRPLSASPARRSLYNTSPRRAPAPRMESLTPVRPSLNRSEILHTPSPARRAASPDRSFDARSSFQTPPRASRAGSPPRELKRSKEVRDHGYERPELETADQISMHHKLCKLHREFYDKYGWTPTLLGDMYDRD